MPYNTRRKSLSLPSLGIHVPGTHPSRSAGRSSTTPESPSPAEYAQVKRLKRPHDADAEATKPPPATRIKHEHTPPPSPEASPPPGEGTARKAAKKNEGEAINDTIVEAVIAQLRATGNRPHLVKELAAVLAQRLTVVQQ